MDNAINSVSLEYYDSKITFFRIRQDKASPIGSAWHAHQFYEIHFCKGEPTEYTYADKTVTLNPLELMIIPPNVFHYSIRPEHLENIYVTSFAVSSAKNSETFPFCNIFTSALAMNALTPIKFSCGSQIDWEDFNNPELFSSLTGVCRLKALASSFVYLLLNQILKTDIAVGEKPEALILIDSMINNPDISLDEMAAATHYSKRQITRLIKQRYGEPLSKLRKNIRERE